jgi:hypothetical protein
MLLRALVAATLCFVSAPVDPQTTIETRPISRVMCIVGTGGSAGTMFRIGPKLAVSANHVTMAPNCIADGEHLNAKPAPDRDYSIIPLQNEGPYLKVDCNGFVKDGHYLALGYARGLPFITQVKLIGTGRKIGEFAALWGIFPVIPGMSGGPIIDADTGKVVGIVNVGEWRSGISGSEELKGTSVCQRS